MALNIQRIQRGTSILTSAGNQVNATITDIDIAKTMLLFTYRSNTAASINDSVRGFITSSTQLTFSCNTAATGTGQQWIEWVIIEFSPDSDITTQHGTTVGGGVATITAVTLANAFVMASFEKSGSSTFGGDDCGWAQLTSTTKVTFYQGAVHDDDTYQVVSSPHFKVQEIQKIKTSGTQVMITIPTAVDLTKSTMSSFIKLTNGGTNTITFNVLPSFQFSAATKIQRDAYAIGLAMDDLIYVVELSGNNKIKPTVQQCIMSVSSTTQISAINTINSINQNSSFLKTLGIIQGLYATNAANDNRFNAQYTLKFNSNTQAFYRRSIAGTAAAAVSQGGFNVVELQYAPTIVFFNAHLRSAYNSTSSTLSWSIVDGQMLGNSKLTNNTFKKSATQWTTYVAPGAAATPSIVSAGSDDFYYKINVTDQGANYYDIQLLSDASPGAFILKQTKPYFLTFKVKNDGGNKNLLLNVELNNGAFTNYRRYNYVSTSAWRVHDVPFTMMSATTSAARLTFQLGLAGTGNIYIDDVYLYEVMSNNPSNKASISIYNDMSKTYFKTGLTTSGGVNVTPSGITRYILSARNNVGWTTWATVVSGAASVVTSVIGAPIFKTYGYGLMMPMTYALQGVNL